MLGNFSYCNPTKLYFGDDSLKALNTELPKYGKNVVLIYGAGSIKKNGIYDEVIEILKANGKNVAEISGVMPNPALITQTCFWRWAAALFATMPRLCRFLCTAATIRGKSTTCVLKNPIARRFPWAACSRWSARVLK